MSKRKAAAQIATPQLGDDHRFFGWLVIRRKVDPGAEGDRDPAMIRNDPRPPGQSTKKTAKDGSPEILGCLSVVPDLRLSVEAGTEIDLVGLYPSREEADKGRTNDKRNFVGALHVALVSFSATAAGDVSVEAPNDVVPGAKVWPVFDERYWSKALLTWPFDDVSAALGKDWREELAKVVGTPLQSGSSVEVAEIRVSLLPLKRDVRDHAKPLIRLEAAEPGLVITSVLGAAGLKVPVAEEQAHAWRVLRHVVMTHLNTPVYYLKRRIARARPFQVALANNLALDAMFSPPNLNNGPTHPLFPGHPSFPSGHATIAHAWAEVVKRLKGESSDEYSAALVMAKAIALRREIAGLHYPSDSEAGKKLAEAIIGKLWNWKHGNGPNGVPETVEALARRAFGL